MTTMLQFPAALEAAGVTVRYLDGWETPHGKNNDYFYRADRFDRHGTIDLDPAGHMHHHVASGHYKPNRDKAQGFAGLSYFGSETLYQERYNEGDYQPVYVIANAYPAPISSGAGDYSVFERVKQDIEVTGRQGPDTPNWYGNTHYWNTEWVCKGDGSPIDEATWEMMEVVCAVQNDMMLWTPNRHIGHGHHTRRKIDLWDGTWGGTAWTGFDLTVEALRSELEKGAGGMWANSITDKTWRVWFEETTVLGTKGNYRYYCKNDGTVDFVAEGEPEWDPSVQRPGGADGGAPYGDSASGKINALNVGFQGYANAIQKLQG